jgi:WD40 repeat protein
MGPLRILVPAILATTTLGAPAAAGNQSAFSADGRQFVSLDGNRTLRFWNVADGKEIASRQLSLASGEVPDTLRYSSKGVICLLRQDKDPDRGLYSYCVLNLDTGERSPRIVISPWAIAISPKGDVLTTERGFWDVATGKKLRDGPLQRALASGIRFSPDGQTAVYQLSESLAQDYAALFLVDVSAGKKLGQIGQIDASKGATFTTGARFSSDSKWLACYQHFPPEVYLWDVRAKRLLHRLTLPTGEEEVVGLTADARHLVTRPWKDKTILRVWDMPVGKLHREISTGARIDEVLLSPDNRTLAVKQGKRFAFRSLFN